MSEGVVPRKKLMAPFDIIVAVDTQKGIGRAGNLPWHIVGDLKHFKQVTTRTQSADAVNMVVMGRKTWDSLPEKFKPLPGRINCVVSRNPGLVLPETVLKAAGLDEALLLAGQPTGKKIERVFVMGGAQVYQIALRHPLCRKIYWTQIHHDFGCDTFIDVNFAGFDKIAESPLQHEEGIHFAFIEYQSLPFNNS